MSKQVEKLWEKGHIKQAFDIHYEDCVRKITGGESGFIGVYEIDVITKGRLIQCKRSLAARDNPKQFIKNNRQQIKRTIQFAKEQRKRAEFWFKGGAAEEVQRYIENYGGIYKEDLDGYTSIPKYNFNR